MDSRIIAEHPYAMEPAPPNASGIISLVTGNVATDFPDEPGERSLGVTSSQVQELVETNKALREVVIAVAGLLKDSSRNAQYPSETRSSNHHVNEDAEEQH
ncbi:MAG: hypothetical protein M1830_002988, partial [Pleopsidium flavum]